MTSFSASRLPQRRTPPSQQATFSSLRPVLEAQRAHDNVPPVSDDPVISRNAAQSSSNLSRATTESIPLRPDTHTPSNRTASDAQEAEKQQNDATKPAKGHTMVGRVTRVGTMNKTVRVSRTIQVWDRHLRKYYKRKAHDMVHDPYNVLNEGDVIEYGSHAALIQQAPSPSVLGDQAVQGTNATVESSEEKRPVNVTYASASSTTTESTGSIVTPTKNVKYVVHQVITPFGLPVQMRPSRTVGSPKGRWEGTAGEVLKGHVRQKARGKSKAH
ncbi:hypothetical protein RBB50_000065 [Rhinocladiella similis]